MTRDEELEYIQKRETEIFKEGGRRHRKEWVKLMDRRHELMKDDPEYQKQQAEADKFWNEVAPNY